MLTTTIKAREKNLLNQTDFKVVCNLSKSQFAGDDKWRFFYSVDITQQKEKARDVTASITYALAGPNNLASTLNNLLYSTGKNTTIIRSGLAEFSHHEGSFEFLSETSLKFQLGIGVVLLQGNKIRGQCIRYTH